MRIIGICGLIGSGKGTLASFLKKEGFKEMSFADPLKDMISVTFGWDRKLLAGDTPESRAWREKEDEFWSEKLEIPNFTPRLALQLIGTDVMRKNLHNDIWVSVLERKIYDYREKLEQKPYFPEEAKVVISDVRFFNEISMIKKLGGKIVRIQRGELPDHWEKTVRYNMQMNGASSDLSPEEFESHGKWLDENIHASEYSWIGVDIPNYVIFNQDGRLDLLKQAAETLANV